MPQNFFLPFSAVGQTRLETLPGCAKGDSPLLPQTWGANRGPPPSPRAGTLPNPPGGGRTRGRRALGGPPRLGRARQQIHQAPQRLPTADGRLARLPLPSPVSTPLSPRREGTETSPRVMTSPTTSSVTVGHRRRCSPGSPASTWWPPSSPLPPSPPPSVPNAASSAPSSPPPPAASPR